MSWDAIRADLERELGEAVSIDALTGPNAIDGGWKIAQRQAGHRHSVDDVLTAWYAVQSFASSDSSADSDSIAATLDLGTGIGTVGLMTLSRLAPGARLVGVEVQAVSYRLLRANIEGNRLGDRVDARHGDLRELEVAERFRLVTGTPPYFPLGTGVLPVDDQRAAARFEFRGDVADYARVAAQQLADDGTFVFCFPTTQRDRALDAVTAAGLVTHAYRDVVPHQSLRPLFTLFRCRRDEAKPVVEPPLIVRRTDGLVTDEMRAIRRSFGFE